MSTFSLPAVGLTAPLVPQHSNEVRRLVLLAPAPDIFPPTFRQVLSDAAVHATLMTQMQQLRGAVYLADGAIRPADLDHDRRHIMPCDHECFHLLALNATHRVVGCVRFLPHRPDISFDQLAVARTPLAKDPILGPALRQAVTEQIVSARQRGILYVEVGGWALDASIRQSMEAIRLALLNFSLGLALGGGVGICTATVRNHSSDILRRIGGRPLTCKGFALPRYFDERYGCEIDILTFDSGLIPERHAARIQEFHATLQATPVVCNQPLISVGLLNLLQEVRIDTPVLAAA